MRIARELTYCKYSNHAQECMSDSNQIEISEMSKNLAGFHMDSSAFGKWGYDEKAKTSELSKPTNIEWKPVQYFEY